MTIGEKIKELRHKNDLTQEKLADYLCVSPQAVSKWECGIASPDIGLIAPLTKLLHVTADELLGLTVEEIDTRKKELEEAFEDTWKTGNLKDRYDVCAAAVAKYPGDMKWLNDLAWVEAMRSFEYKNDETYADEQEKAIKKFAQVIEDCEDEKVKKSAIEGIVQYLGFRGRNDEAKKYAELYPKNDEDGYNRIMDLTLSGEERLEYEQKVTEKALDRFMTALSVNGNSYNPLVYDVILKTLEVAFPDGNYLLYHGFARDAYKAKAEMHAKEGKLDLAMEELKKAHFHVCEFDKVDYIGNTGVFKYTTPLFDRLSVDTNEFFHSGDDSAEKVFLSFLSQQSDWDPLRDREDFKELLAGNHTEH